MFATVLVRFAGSRIGVPLDKLKRVLVAALQVPFYRNALERAGLGSPAAVRSVPSVETAMEALPATALHEWQSWPARCAPDVVWRWRRSYPSGVLTASSEWLLGMARSGNAPPVRHSVVVLTAFGASPLSEDDRDLLWRAFRVPVFEHLLGPDGQVFAAECAAHQELHLFSERAILETRSGELLVTSLTSLRRPALRVAAGLPFQVRNGPCACGQTIWRLCPR